MGIPKPKHTGLHHSLSLSRGANRECCAATTRSHDLVGTNLGL